MLQSFVSSMSTVTSMYLFRLPPMALLLPYVQRLLVLTYVQRLLVLPYVRRLLGKGFFSCKFNFYIFEKYDACGAHCCAD